MSCAVSVIITTYNDDACLEAALDSVCRQGIDDLQLIVVDDGSDTDAALLICDSAERRQRQAITYIRKENGGPSSARNKGLQEAVGPYVAFLDADDLFVSSKLRTQCALLDACSPCYGAVLGGCIKFNDYNHQCRKLVLPPTVDGHFDTADFLIGALRLEGTPGYLFRRQALVDVGGFDEDLWNNEDFDLIVRLNKLYKIKTHSDVVFKQRLRADSLSHGDPIRALNGRLQFTAKMEKTLPSLPGKVFMRMRQRAFFSVAVAGWKKGQYREFVWLVRQARVSGGWPSSAKGIFAYCCVVPLSRLGKRPDGVNVP